MVQGMRPQEAVCGRFCSVVIPIAPSAYWYCGLYDEGNTLRRIAIRICALRARLLLFT